MPQIPPELKSKAEELFNQGFKRAQIASKLGISIERAGYCIFLARLKEKGFERPIDERDYWARQKGYDSYSQYQFSILNARGFTYTQARKNFLKKRKFESEQEYKDDLARRQGYDSRFEKEDEMKKKPEKQELKDLVRGGLDRIGRTQTWLAGELGLTKQGVSTYANAKAFPRNGMLEKLVEILQVSQGQLHNRYPAISEFLSDSGRK